MNLYYEPISQVYEILSLSLIHVDPFNTKTHVDKFQPRKITSAQINGAFRFPFPNRLDKANYTCQPYLLATFLFHG